MGPAMLDCGLFDTDAVAAMLDQHVSGSFDHSDTLWLLLVFEGFLASQAWMPPS
jgi:asparagine synthase (glutamine-hydrolysing)